MLFKLFPALSLSARAAPCAAQQRSVSLLSRAAVRAIKECLDKPKGGVSGYKLFFQEKYPQLKREFPNFGVVDIGRRLGSQWKGLSEVEKKTYQDRAAKASEQSRADMHAYRESLTPRQKLARRALYYDGRYRKRAIARCELPREVKEFVKQIPASPFVTGRSMFMASKLRGRADTLDLIGAVAAEWKSLPAAEASAFDSRALADMRMFKDAVAKYIQ